MHLTKTVKTVISTICIIVLVAALALAAFLLMRPTDTPKQNFTLYFLDSTGSNFSKEVRAIEVDAHTVADDEALLRLLCEALITGPKDAVVNKRAIPADTKVNALTINENKIATVDFSSAFYNATDLENNLAVCTVVLTLCETEKVDKVAVHVNGKEIIGQGKIALGALGKEDIVNASDPAEIRTQKTLRLYFAGRNTEHVLIAEDRALQVDGDKINELTILNELIKGTNIPDAMSLIPASTKVLSCETKEGICYVNLSRDFMDKKPEGSSSETLLIDSIVYTLTEMDSISKVVFLIEGEKAETFGQRVFHEPFERSNNAIIRVQVQ